MNFSQFHLKCSTKAAEGMDQDQTAQNMQPDLNLCLHQKYESYLWRRNELTLNLSNQIFDVYILNKRETLHIYSILK